MYITRPITFFATFDIDSDNNDKIILVLTSRVGGFGNIVIISKSGDIVNVRWNKPVNALYFDYLIERSDARSYKRFGLVGSGDENVSIPVPHLVTKGFLTRIIYWNGTSYQQERISFLGESRE